MSFGNQHYIIKVLMYGQFFNPIIESINHPMLLVTFQINYWFL